MSSNITLLRVHMIATLLMMLSLQIFSLFATTPSHNFTILPWFTAAPKDIVLQGTGTKLIAWNHKGEIAIFGINGLFLCSGNISVPIKQVIWPDYYNPILLLDQGQKFATYSEFTCTPIKTYDLQIITGVKGQHAQSLTFTRRYNYPLVTVSGVLAGYQINLNASSLNNVYQTMDPTLPIITRVAYSAPITPSNIFFSIIDKNNNSYVRVWQTKVNKGPYLRQVSFKDTTIQEMRPSINYPYVVTQGSSLSDQNSTVIQIFETYSIPTTKIKRQKTGQSRLITDGNLFDAVVFTNVEKYSFEVFRVDGGVSLQNITNPQIYNAFSIDYANRVLIIVDSAGRVITYSYENDKLVEKNLVSKD